MSLLDYITRQQDCIFDSEVANWVVTYLLKAIDYLHTSGVVHTEIRLDNIQNTLPDEEDTILAGLVNVERLQPSYRRVIDNTRTIYTTRPLEYGGMMTFLILCDLGTSVFGEQKYEEIIQAIPYRSPEVILRMRWNSSVDIWNLGVLVWELLFAEYLFGNDNEQDSLRKMVTHLGPPPSDWLERSQLRGHYFDNSGEWRISSIQSIPLEERLDKMTDMKVFLDFIRSMLDWVPEKRKTAAGLLKHPWLKPQ